MRRAEAFTQTDLAVLEQVAKGSLSLKKLVEGEKVGLFAGIKSISRLVDYGLVKKTRNRSGVTVELAQLQLGALFRHICFYRPGIPLHRLLSGDYLKIVLSMRQEADYRAILRDSGVSVATLKRFFSQFRKWGVVGSKKRGRYFLFDAAIFDLATILWEAHIRAIYPELQAGTQIYFAGKRLVAVTFMPIESKRLFQTGLSTFEMFGVPIIQRDRWFYSSWEPRVEDVIIHALLPKPSDYSVQLLVLILMKKAGFDERYLSEEAALFGVREVVENLIRYVSSNGAGGFDLPWQEFMRKARDYGIKK